MDHKRAQRLEKLNASLGAKLGDKVSIVKPSEMKTAYHIRRPTGIASMDIALRGGLPGGVIVQLHGEESVGKTALAMQLCNMNQQIYGDGACSFFTGFGYKVDLSLARLLGMQIAYSDDEIRGLGYDPEEPPEEIADLETIGQFLTIKLNNKAEVRGAPAEHLLNTVVVALESGAFQIGVVDELGSGETKHDVVKDLEEDKKMASWAKLIADFLIKVYSRYRIDLDDGEPLSTTLIVINPARANLDKPSGPAAKYAPKTTETSGHALKHAKAIDIHLRKKKPIRDKDGAIIEFTIVWTIAKGKHGVPAGATGEIQWKRDSGFDVYGDLVNQAKKLGVIRRAGKYYKMEIEASEEELEDAEIDTEDGYRTLSFEGGLGGVEAAVRDDPELYFDMYNAVIFAALGHNPLFNEDL